MSYLIILLTGVALGVAYEKVIIVLKDKAVKAVKDTFQD